jgi:hypothetical protein
MVDSAVTVAMDLIPHVPQIEIQSVFEGTKRTVEVVFPLAFHAFVLDKILIYLFKNQKLVTILGGVSAAGTGGYLFYHNIKVLTAYERMNEKKKLFQIKLQEWEEKSKNSEKEKAQLTLFQKRNKQTIEVYTNFQDSPAIRLLIIAKIFFSCLLAFKGYGGLFFGIWQ